MALNNRSGFASLAGNLDYLHETVIASAVNTYTSSCVLQLVDGGAVVEMSSGSGITATIPTNAAIPFPIGTTITLVAIGTGTVTIAAANGVTLLSVSSLVTISAQYAAATIYQRAPDAWVLIGSLA